MIVACAPIVALLLGVASIHVPWGTFLLSVLLYIVVPVIAAQLWRGWLLRRHGSAALETTLHRLDPWSTAALLATLVLLFGFQGEAILAQPLIIALLAVPIIIQVYLNAGIARSEEHTSELQSLMRISYAVFCLKKKKQTRKITHKH